MFAFSILIVLARLGLSIPDACSFREPGSVCQESGYCSAPLTDFTCTQAYLLISDNISVILDQPPITPPYDQAATAALTFMRASNFARPGQWESEPFFVELNQCFEAFVMKFQNQYPKVIIDIPLLQRLVSAAANIRTQIILPMIQPGRSRRRLGEFLACIVQSRAVKSIEAYFDAIVEYLESSDILDPIRKAIISNLGPYLHVWISIFQLLRLPYPFHARGFSELMTHAAQYDPLYPLSAEDRVWTISLDHSSPYHYMPPFVFQPGEESNIDDFFIPFVQRMESIAVTPSPENIVRVIQNALMLVLAQHNIRSISVAQITNVIKPFFFYLRTQIQGSGISLEPFCASTRNNWISLFAIISSWRQHGPFPYLLDIFRICGRQYLSLLDRVLIVLPTIIGSRGPSGCSLSLIHQLRREVDSASPEISHVDFLTDFIESSNTTDAPILQRIGNFVAWSVIEGDPHGILQTLLQQRITPNFYFQSESVKRGFCQVLNCLAFDVLFGNTELVELLEILRTQVVFQVAGWTWEMIAAPHAFV